METSNPWEMDWGIPQTEQVEEQSPSEGAPWLKDWGIEQYIKSVPKRAREAVDSVKSYSVDSLFDRVIQQESRGRHTTADGTLLTSNKGARGISQVMPKTGVDPGYGVAPLKNETEEEYRRFGKDYLQAMLNKYGGDYRRAVS